MKLLGVISVAVLARILTPADFGLVATATAFVGMLQVLSEFSFDLALIRDQKATRADYDTVWTMTVLRGIATTVILGAGAGAIAGFFEEARLETIMWALAFSALIDGFVNVRIVDFRKELNFQKEFVLLVTAKVISFAVTIGLAFAWRNYWALVAGVLANTGARLALSYALLPYMPRFTLVVWRDITNFSKWFLISNIVGYLGQRLDAFVIGKLRGPEGVGLYSAANEIAGMITSELLFPIQRVLTPGLAKLAGDLPAMRSAFFKIYGLSALVTLPAVIGLGLVADPLVRIVLGPRWLATIPIIQVLAFVYAFWLMFSVFYPVYVALGQQRRWVYSSILTVGILVPSMTVGVVLRGPIGAAYAQFVAAVVVFCINVFWFRRILEAPLADFIANIWRPALATAVMALAVSACDQAWSRSDPASEPVLHLVVLVAVGAVTYSGALLLVWYMSGRPSGGETTAFSLCWQYLGPRLKRRTTGQ
jgi:O-antigen/teichoic acid export membrane protein